MTGPAIVELARAAVRRLADAAPGDPLAKEARTALARIERVGLGPPYTVALAGEPAARAALLNRLAGLPLFDPNRPEAERIVMSLRRGKATRLRARRRDGTVEERVLDEAIRAEDTEDAEDGSNAPTVPLPPVSGAAEAPEPAAARPSDRAETVPAGDLPAFRDAIVLSAEAETTALVRRPPWWAVWRWLTLWWRTWRDRRAAEPPDARATREARTAAAVAAAVAEAGTARRGFASTVARGQRSGAAEAAAVAEAGTARRGFASTVARDKRSGAARTAFLAAVSGCLADDAVERLFVEVGGGLLPDSVVVIELPSRANARSLDAIGADACLVACGSEGFALTTQLATALDVVPHVFAIGDAELAADCAPRVRRLGPGELTAALVPLATIERALAVGAEALEALEAGSTAIDAAVGRVENQFRARLHRLEVLQIPDPDAYLVLALARVRGALAADVPGLLRGAHDLLERAIAELGAAWAARITAAGSTEALRAAAAQIDGESPAALQAALTEAHRALVDGLTERARSLYAALVGELRHGTPRDGAAPSWLTAELEIEPLATGIELGAVAPRLTSLFRSRDALRSEALAVLDQRLAAHHQLAAARVLDTEPRLEPAVTAALAIAMRGELERHAGWLEAELARERVAIEAERASLAVLALARNAARADERELGTALDALAAELPGAGPRRPPRDARSL